MLEARLIGGIGNWFSQRVVKIRRNLSPEDWTHVSLLFSSFFFIVGEPIEESRLDRARRTTEGRKNELMFLLGNGAASSFYFFLFSLILLVLQAVSTGVVVQLTSAKLPLNRKVSSTDSMMLV